MNHTQRIAHVARQKRYLTKAIVREAVELYLEALAEEIAEGDWVDLKGIGKIQIVLENTNAQLYSFTTGGKRIKTTAKHKLRTRLRLFKKYKLRCRQEQSHP